MQMCVNVGHIFKYYQEVSAAQAAASVVAGKSTRESELEKQLEHARAQVTRHVCVCVCVRLCVCVVQTKQCTWL